MRDWFDSLAPRERLFVSVGAVAVVFALLYAFIWAPLDTGHKALRASVTDWERSLAELRPLRGSAAAVTNVAPRSSGSQQTPVVIVDQTLRARGLDRALRRSQPTTSNGIRVEFENVAFDDLVLWLDDLGRQYAMQVASGSLSTSSQAAPGRIDATLTLERSL
ncbi:MAG: type II secretion system protein GspM [Woeseiaceae bacterium]|nr:type II secretion system protein GspM [Woeseiaceae bacterium]